MPPFWKKVSVLAAISLASWLINEYMHTEKNGAARPTITVTLTGSRDIIVVNWWINDCQTRTSNDFNSFKYGPSDLCCDHPISIRGIPLTPHQSTRIMVIPSHEMATCQHHSDVVLQFQPHDTSLLRCNTTCLPGLFPCLTRIVCFTSLTDGCIVTCRTFFRLYCLRVF